MRQYALRRLTYLPLIAVAVSLIVFFTLRLPFAQDPVDLHSGLDTTEAQRTAMREEFGLDKPVWEQFVTWVSDMARGDLGKTFTGRQPVGEQIKSRLPVTFEILFLSVTFSTVFGIAFGIISAMKQDTPIDYFFRVLAVFGQSIPEFFLLILLIVLPSIWWNYAPPSGANLGFFENPTENLRLFLPPTLLLAVGGSATMMRITRSTLLEVFRQDYIRTAQAKGLAQNTVVLRHALRNSMIPIVTLIGGHITALLFGAVILEQIMSINGLGQFLYRSLLQSDFPVIQFLVFYIALGVILMNLLIDLSYAFIDPRVKYS
jgi:peptide/nickel transport system permease protein